MGWGNISSFLGTSGLILILLGLFISFTDKLRRGDSKNG